MQIHNAILTGSTTVYGPINILSGSLTGTSSYAATSSYSTAFTVGGTLTAQTLVVQTITASIEYSSGSNIFGSVLSNTQTLTGSVNITGGINLNNSKAIIGDDISYGAAYQTLAFGSATNGYNRISGHSGTLDGLYFMAATGRGFVFRPNGSTIGNFIIASTGRVGIGTNLSGPSALLHISGSGSDPLMQISSTVSSSIFFVSGSGNIGIGTTTVPARLTSYYFGGATANLGDNIVLGVGTDGGVVGTFTQIGIGYHNGTAGNYYPVVIGSVIENSAGQNAEAIVFATRITPTGTVRPTEKMRITASGSVGIGITNPSALLHISGSGSGSLMQISSTVSSSIFFVSGSGNIGIGTSTLTAYATRFLQIHNSSGNSALRLTNSTTGTTRDDGFDIEMRTSDVYLVARDAGFNMLFGTQDTGRMFISASGNVGIGTTTPSVTLDVSGQVRINSSYPQLTISGSDALITMYDTLQPYAYSIGVGYNKNYAFEIIDRGVSGTSNNTVLIATGSNIGINTTSPAQQLHVYNTSNYVGALINGSNAPQLCFAQGVSTSPSWKVGISGNDGTAFSISSGSINADKLFITSTGQVTIGSTSDVGRRLYVLGQGSTSATVNTTFDNSVGTTILSLRNDGIIFAPQTYGNTVSTPRTMYIASDGQLGGISSIRASKTNIQSFDSNWIYQLNPVQFNYRKKDENEEYTNEFDNELFYGLIAEETELVNKQICTYNNDKLIGIEYSKLVPVLVKAVQELSTKLDEATTRIIALESK